MDHSPRRAQRRAPRRAVAVLGLVSLALTSLGGAAHASAGDDLAPLLLTDSADAVDGRYVVVLDGPASPARTATGKGRADARVTGPQRGLGAQAADRARALGARVVHTYDATVAGYAAELTPSQLAKVRRDPAVAYVEADQVVSLAATQSNATWGLDRIDQRTRPLNGTYVYGPTGAGVDAYVIDTGVLGSHQEFSGRMASGYTAINDGRGTSDCNGHGTHVAGTVAGTVYGVAKQATVVPVRVLGCTGSGTNSGVIAGIDWVASTASGPSVANMSLGGGASQATDDAVQRAVSRGVTMVVAAGNENQNACNVSPARAVERHHRREHDEHRRPLELLQLRHLRGRLRARVEHHLGLVPVDHPDQHDQRHVHGLPARRGRRGAVPADQPVRLARDRDELPGVQQHDGPRHRGGHRLAEPAALHRLPRWRHHDPASDQRPLRPGVRDVHRHPRERGVHHAADRLLLLLDEREPRRLPHRSVLGRLRPVPAALERQLVGQRGQRHRHLVDRDGQLLRHRRLLHVADPLLQRVGVLHPRHEAAVTARP